MKKIVSLILSFTLFFSLSNPAFAIASQSEDEFCIDDYIPYTINLSYEDANTLATATDDSIDRAIAYVKSLRLGDMGFSYIEEACLNELIAYKDDDIILENYTVLIPKAKTKNYYGTYLGKDYYYEYTSTADIRRETKGEEKNESNEIQWDFWVLGTADLGMCFAKYKWSIPYSIIRTITGIGEPEEIYYESYNEYVEQFTDIVTRTIFRKENSNYKASYQDQTSSLRVNWYFCPVGTAFDSDYISCGTVYDSDVSATDLSKEEILQAAHIHANRGSKVIHKITYHRLQEEWE